MAKEHNFVPLLDLEIHIVEKHFPIDTCTESLHLKDFITRLAIGSEDDSRVAARRWLDFLDIEFFQHLLATCSLLRLGNIGAETLNKLEQLLALFLSLLVLLLLLTQSELTRLIPEAIVTGKERNLIVIDVESVSGNGIEKVAVVRNHEDSILAVGEILFEPSDSVEVEVVGRLIEEEVIGITKKSLGKKDTHLFLTTEVLH